jgi:dTDP-4-dehydrorhamnose 3,5-epimerase-like enzyme
MKKQVGMRMQVVEPACNLNTIKDGRGAIFSFVPPQPIAEWTHQFIKAGTIRGNHYHPEFDEYVLLINGAGVEVEKNRKTKKEYFIQMGKGSCIFIPRNTLHVFMAITDCESVSFLTKAWDACKVPIVHENVGYGKGDHGDPESPFYKERNKK